MKPAPTMGMNSRAMVAPMGARVRYHSVQVRENWPLPRKPVKDVMACRVAPRAPEAASSARNDGSVSRVSLLMTGWAARTSLWFHGSSGAWKACSRPGHWVMNTAKAISQTTDRPAPTSQAQRRVVQKPSSGPAAATAAPPAVAGVGGTSGGFGGSGAVAGSAAPAVRPPPPLPSEAGAGVCPSRWVRSLLSLVASAMLCLPIRGKHPRRALSNEQAV